MTLCERPAQERERRERRNPDEQIPCLEDVLARFADRAYLDIEIKIPGFEEEIVGGDPDTTGHSGIS